MEVNNASKSDKIEKIDKQGNPCLSISLSLSLSLSLSIYIYMSSSSRADNTEIFDSLTNHPYRPSLLASPLDCIQCQDRADVCKSLLVDKHLGVHVLESIEERHL